MGSPAIRLQGVSKQYAVGTARPDTLRDRLAGAARAVLRGRTSRESDVVWALRDVTFDVERGDVVGLVGRNGAGKTTLLEIVARITRPTAGRIEIHGNVGALLEVGTGFHRELSGRENVFMNGVILGMSRSEVARKLDEIVDFAGIGAFLDAPVKQYSSGMQIRLAFAVAAHLQPEILLVDEVLAVGDIEFQRRCIGRMEQVAREGRTVIVVSHHLGTVRTLCRRAILLDHGRVERAGPVDDVLETYVAEHAASAASQDVADRDHVDGVRELKVERVMLVNGVGGRFVVYWRQPLQLRVRVEARRPVDDVSFAAGIRTADGMPVFTTHQDDDGSTRWRFEPGRYDVDVTLDNTLRPGIYRLHIGADQGRMAMRNILYTESVYLEVLGYAEDGAVPAASNTGYVNGGATWHRPEAVR